MAKDTLEALLERLKAKEGAPIPTSALGRLRRTAAAGARVGLGAVAGRFRGNEMNLGSLSPESPHPLRSLRGAGPHRRGARLGGARG